jgi:hypothetical protein
MAIRYLSGINVDSNTLFVDDANNRVGIGTASPLLNLQINSLSGNNSTLAFSVNNSLTWYLRHNAGDGSLQIVDVVNTTSRLVVLNSGNVGIGTTSPSAKLEVIGQGSGSVKMGSTGFGGDWVGISLSGNLNTTDYNLLSSATNASFFLNRPSGGDMLFRHNNVDQMIIKSSGNVGIGTTSPQSKLQIGTTNFSITDRTSAVYGAAASETIFTVGISGVDYPQLLNFGVNQSGLYSTISARQFTVATENKLVLQPNGGNVGIGTTSPTRTLHVAGLSYFGSDIFGLVNNGIFFSGDGSYNAGIYGRNSGSDLVLQSGGSERMRIASGGNVGIGTSNPGAKLEVQGTIFINADGDLLFDNTSGGAGFQMDYYDGQMYFGNQAGTSWHIVMKDNGNVGIGTTSPTVTLEVSGRGLITSSGSGDTFAVTHSSGSGIGVNITKGGNGEGLYVNKTSGSGNAVTIVGTLNATTLVKSGGTSSQYLMADGSVSTLTNPVTGTGTTNYVPKWTSGTAIGNSAIYDNAGNIGIGLTNADYPLTVGSINVGGAGANLGLVLNSVISTAIPSSSVKAIIGATNSGFGYAAGSLLIQPRTGVNAVTVFATEGTEKMRITHDGNVGIGTTSPVVKLQVDGTITSTGVLTAYTSVPSINIGHNGDSAFIAATSGSGANTPISFSVGNNNEKMRITAAGNVGIGTTSPDALLNVGGGDGTPTATQFTAVVRGTSTRTMYFDGGGSSGASVWWGDGNTPQFAIDSISGGGAAMWVHASSAWYRIIDVNANGNVGINQTAPTQKLDIFGNISLGSWTKAGNTYVGLRRADDGTFGNGGDSGLVIESYNHAAPYNGNYSQKVHLRTHLYNGGSHDVITGYGLNVGIGVTTPNEKLNVGGNVSVNSSGSKIGFNTTDAFAGYSTSIAHYGISYGWNTNPLALSGYYGVGIFTEGSEKVRILGNGNVGIGTTAPVSALSVVGKTNLGNQASGFYVTPSTLHIASSTVSQISFEDYVVTAAIAIANNTFAFGHQNASPSYEFKHSNTYNGNYATTGTTFARFNPTTSYISAGNVGIGTTSPADKLYVGDSSGTSISISTNNAAGSIASPLNVDLNFRGYLNGKMAMIRSWDESSSTADGYLTFWTNDFTGGVNVFTEKMRIGPTGSIKLNSYGSGSNTGTATQRLAVDASGNVIEIPIGSGPVDGNGTANYVTKWSDADTITNSIIYDNGTNVGIGSTIPAQKLQVNGAIEAGPSSVAGGPIIYQSYASPNYIGSIGSEYSSGAVLIGYGATGKSGASGYVSTFENFSGVRGLLRLASGSFSVLSSATAVNTAIGGDLTMTTTFTVTDAGNVGIGTTSPTRRLHIVSSDDTRGIMVEQTSASSYAEVHFKANREYRIGTGGSTSAAEAANNWYVYDATAALQRFVITSAGNVGIGTTSPDSLLQIGESYQTTAGTNKKIIVNIGGYYSTGSGIQYQVLGFTGTTFDESDIFTQTGGETSKNFYIGIVSDGGYFNANRFSIIGNGAERLTVKPDSGNVGIGTTSPTNKLYIVSSAQNSGLSVMDFNGAGGWGGGINLGVSGLSFESLGKVYTYLTNSGPGTVAGDMRFQTASGSALSDRMVITSGGNVGIGTTAPGYKLEVNGDAGGSPVNIARFTAGIAGGGTRGMNLYSDGTQFKLQVTDNVGNFGDWAFLNLNPDGGFVGVGNTSPSQKLHVTGNVRVTGAYYDSNNEAGTSGQVLTSTGTGTDWKSLSEITGVDGTGTANYVAKWSDTDTIANSQIRDDGTTVGIGTAPAAAKLTVNGPVNVGGRYLYNNSQAALDTTGVNVAGLSASTNGDSAFFTFEAGAGDGQYQRIVYSCYNAGGTWNVVKVIDEGTNRFDVVASASSGSTITFTWKSRSGIIYYTPRLIITGVGSIDTTYL